MKLDTLVDMAKETAAFGVHPSGEFIYSFYTEQLQAFAKLIAEHEREACAKVCEEYETSNDITATWLNIVADAIRARGQA